MAAFTRSVGFTEELLLIDRATLLPTPVAARVLREDTARLSSGAELGRTSFREQVRVVSSPLATWHDLYAAALEARQAADVAAQTHGARVAALGTAPVSLSTPLSLGITPQARPVPSELERPLTCGLHIRVSTGSDEEGVAVLDRIRPWLPVLVALSSNSPFWQGADSSFESYRYQLSARWPAAGTYNPFGNSATYWKRLAETGVAGEPWDDSTLLDARLAEHGSAVEIRLTDVCLEVVDSATMGILVRALVARAASDWQSGRPVDDVDSSVLRLASWRASRWALGQELVHPITRRPCAARAAVYELLAHVADHFVDAAEADRVIGGVRHILRRGTGATRQRRVWNAQRNVQAVVADAISATLDPVFA